MIAPSPIQVRAALETLQAAGWQISAPSSERIRLLNAASVADLMQVSVGTARGIIKSIPTSVMMPGGDLRVRLADLERWMEARPAAAPGLFAQSA